MLAVLAWAQRATCITHLRSKPNPGNIQPDPNRIRGYQLNSRLRPKTQATHSLLAQENERYSTNMNWSLVSLALVFPLVYSIGQAFRRREEALDDIADVKSLLCQSFLAHINWDWTQGCTMPKQPWYGRQALPEGFNDRSHANLVSIVARSTEPSRSVVCNYNPEICFYPGCSCMTKRHIRFFWQLH